LQTDKSINSLAENNIAIVREASPNQNEDCDTSSTSQHTKEFCLNILPKYLQPEVPKLNFSKYFQDILKMYIEEQFDFPTAITMYLVACKSSCFKVNSINESYLDEWFTQYIELLAKYDQWILRSEILKAHQSESLEKLTQISINYLTMCAMCKEEIPRSTLVCSKCKKNPFLCSLCHLPVKTLYTWCHLCYHGGHMKHLQNWFSKQRECPTGCGCLCWNSNSKID
jgi:WD repeat-containing protein 24